MNTGQKQSLKYQHTKNLIAIVRSENVTDQTKVNAAIGSFEPVFFNITR